MEDAVVRVVVAVVVAALWSLCSLLFVWWSLCSLYLFLRLPGETYCRRSRVVMHFTGMNVW